MRIASAFTACLTAASLLACATTNETLDTKTKKGAVIGTLAGAAAGAAIGGHEHRAGGALIGAATGALAGGLIGRYMDNQAKELDAIPGADVTRTDDSLLVNFQGQFLFDSGKTDLNPGAYDRLDQLARTLNNYPKSQVKITGHTDSQGADDFNLRLSEQRADRVREYLIHQGVSASRISSFGMGEARPLASNNTEAGRQQNRRVEIEIRPDAEVMQGEPVQ
jgi:outer membrane protein OmpA-like peptidoglycan-associated protein